MDLKGEDDTKGGELNCGYKCLQEEMVFDISLSSGEGWEEGVLQVPCGDKAAVMCPPNWCFYGKGPAADLTPCGPNLCEPMGFKLDE